MTGRVLPRSTGRRRAVLIGGVVGDGSVSMARYARDISAALAQLDQTQWQFDLVQPEAKRWISRVWRHAQATRLESAISRYVAYPAAMYGHRASELFHVLDHGYGHLVRALDPDRTVVTCHDLIPLLSADHQIPIVVPATVVRTFRFRIREMSRATRILADSEATHDSLLKYTDIPPSRIVVIRPGVNPIFRTGELDQSEATRRLVGIPSNAAVILQVATRGRYKNTPGALRAFSLLRTRLACRLFFVRIGAPLYEDEADLADSLGVTEDIRYLGKVDDPTLVDWYRAASVLVFPSFWEGFGWPPLEAMACGTPVVASSIPAVKEVVADAADLVDPEDDVAIARALERVIADPAHAAGLRTKGLARARLLTWEESARRTLAVYDEVYRGLGLNVRVS